LGDFGILKLGDWGCGNLKYRLFFEENTKLIAFNSLLLCLGYRFGLSKQSF